MPLAKERVGQAFSLAVERVKPDGFLVLFDGLESPGNGSHMVTIRFLTVQAREQFDIFVREYRPFHITAKYSRDPFVVELSRRDFTRYIDKSIFLGKHLWPQERFESYQYWTETEFRAAFAHAGLEISELRTLTENYEKWNAVVEN